MKTFLVDTHTHTIASGHAYGTLTEMAKAAAEAGLYALAITDHAPALPGTCHEIYFRNFKVIPKEMFGVKILMGAELNILDSEGHVDLPEEILKRMDLCNASMHTLVYASQGRAADTRAMLKVMENPYVTTIGHPEDGHYDIDFEEMVKAAKANHKLIEMNNSSLLPCSRLNTRENQTKILKLCEKYGQEIIVNTDSHFPTQVGHFEAEIELLTEVGFPQELIVNTNLESFKKYLRKPLL